MIHILRCMDLMSKERLSNNYYVCACVRVTIHFQFCFLGCWVKRLHSHELITKSTYFDRIYLTTATGMAGSKAADPDSLLAVVPLLTGSEDVNALLEGKGG